MDHHHAGELIAAADEAYALRLNICVWSKNNAGLGKLWRMRRSRIRARQLAALLVTCPTSHLFFATVAILSYVNKTRRYNGTERFE